MTARPGQPLPGHRRTAPVFLAVGIAATLVHAVVGLSVASLGVAAFVANLIAFGVAFLVSYFGHRRFSFASTARHRSALPRFGAVAVTGLAINQALVLVIVNGAGLPYAVALIAIFLTVPPVTYALSRAWAFA